jgi:hypothetical protein
VAQDASSHAAQTSNNALRLALIVLPSYVDVSSSRRVRYSKASVRVSPHISLDGCRLPHTAGRSGLPKILQRFSSSSCTQRTPAGFPFGIPGIGDEIDGAIQQAPQPARQESSFATLFATLFIT